MSINTKSKTNSKGDIVTVPVGYEAYEKMFITIPRKGMNNLSDAYAAFYGAKIALPILSMAGYCIPRFRTVYWSLTACVYAFTRVHSRCEDPRYYCRSCRGED